MWWPRICGDLEYVMAQNMWRLSTSSSVFVLKLPPMKNVNLRMACIVSWFFSVNFGWQLVPRNNKLYICCGFSVNYEWQLVPRNSKLYICASTSHPNGSVCYETVFMFLSYMGLLILMSKNIFLFVILIISYKLNNKTWTLVTQLLGVGESFMKGNEILNYSLVWSIFLL